MINKRIFGSDIPVKVKKKLEARQLLATRERDPNESIRETQYKAKRPSYYTFNEIVDNNTKSLSSQVQLKLPKLKKVGNKIEQPKIKLPKLKKVTEQERLTV